MGLPSASQGALWVISAGAHRGLARRAPVVTRFTAEDENHGVRSTTCTESNGSTPHRPWHLFTCPSSPGFHGLSDGQKGLSTCSCRDPPRCGPPPAASEWTQDLHRAPVLAIRDRISESPEQEDGKTVPPDLKAAPVWGRKGRYVRCKRPIPSCGLVSVCPAL